MSEQKMSHTSPKRGKMFGGPMGGGPGMGPVEKPKDMKKTFRKLVAYLSKFHFAMVVVVIFTIASTAFGIFGPKILGKATTKIFEGLVDKIQGGSGIDFEKIGAILLGLVGLYIISTFFNYIQGLIMTNISQKVAFQMRKELSEKLHVLPMNYYDQRTYGEILSRITNDVDTLGQGLNMSITQLISSIAMIIGVLVMMISISWQMTVAAIMILPVSAFMIGFIMKNSQKYFKGQQEYLQWSSSGQTLYSRKTDD